MIIGRKRFNYTKNKQDKEMYKIKPETSLLLGEFVFLSLVLINMLVEAAVIVAN